MEEKVLITPQEKIDELEYLNKKYKEALFRIYTHKKNSTYYIDYLELKEIAEESLNLKYEK